VAAEKVCPFCIVDESKNRVFYEGARVYATLSNPRLMAGHLLVIPRQHVGAPFELNPTEQQELFDTALRFQKKLIEVFSGIWNKPAGCDLSIHTRPFMPQTELSIPGHVHVHLRPRFWQDPYWGHVLRHEDDVFQPLSPEEQEKIQALLVE